MDNEERKKLILDYIGAHENEGCSPTSVVDALSSKMCRQTFFKCLTEIKGHKMVFEERVNKRDKLLHINKKDLMVVVTSELDSFQESYLTLLRKILKIIESPEGSLHKRNPKLTQEEINRINYGFLTDMLSFYKHMMNGYTEKLVLKWPLAISDKKYLAQLQFTTLTRLSKLLFEIMEQVKKSNIDKYVKSINSKLSLDQVLERIINFKDHDLMRSNGEILRSWAREFKLLNLQDEAMDIVKRI